MLRTFVRLSPSLLSIGKFPRIARTVSPVSVTARGYNHLVKPLNHRCNAITAWTKLWSRDVVLFSKNKGKRKTVKAVAKRFKRIGSGALKYWRAGKNHKMIVKSGRASRNLRKPRYVNKTQLKTLNKMLSGI